MFTKSFLKIVIVLLLLGSSFGQTLFATDHIETLDAEIDSVTVYLNGAEVNRSVAIDLKQGDTKIMITGLSGQMDINSLRLSLGGNARILSVASQTIPVNHAAKTALTDSIELLTNQINGIVNRKQGFTEEQRLLKQNNVPYFGANTESDFDVSKLRTAADFYRERTTLIKDSIYALDKRRNKINLHLEALQNRNAKLVKRFLQTTYNVELVVQALQATKGTVLLSYLVNRAQWQPTYNLRATDIADPVKLEYNGKVFNDTGVDWENVQLTLSTADPTKDAAIPNMETWILSNVANLRQRNQSYLGGEGRLNNFRGNVYSKMDANGNFEDGYDSQKKVLGNVRASVSPDFVEIAVPELSAAFRIDIPYTIPADAVPYSVAVTDYSVDASYNYLAIPKVDKGVFLIASITNWQDLNLVEGPANVYYRDAYMGASYINTRNVSDTLKVSLGRDNQVMVTRSKRKDESSKKIIGLNVRENMVYEIIAKNNRNQNISLEIWDQVPITTASNIDVVIKNISKAKQDEASGKLEWVLNMKPGESRKLLIDFTVKYPKGVNINLNKNQRIRTPRYFNP